MDKSGIIHYFGEYLLWDVYVQGVFACLTLLVGISLWIYTIADYFDPEKNVDMVDYLKNRYRGLYDLITITVKLNILKYISYVVISLSIIYTIGIVVSTLSDNFMDSPDSWHIYLKKYWASELHSEDKLRKNFINNANFKNYKDSDNLVKLLVFSKIFSINKDGEKIYTDSLNRRFYLRAIGDTSGSFRREIYYHAKHSLLKDNNWKQYINYSQNIVNVAQVICSCFFVLMLMSYMNYFFDIIRLLREFNYNKKAGIRDSTVYYKIIIYALVTSAALGMALYFNVHFFILFNISIFCTWLALWYYGKSNAWLGRRLRATFIISSIAMMGYYASAITWLRNEIEICNKVYGVFRYEQNSALIPNDIYRTYIFKK